MQLSWNTLSVPAAILATKNGAPREARAVEHLLLSTPHPRGTLKHDHRPRAPMRGEHPQTAVAVPREQPPNGRLYDHRRALPRPALSAVRALVPRRAPPTTAGGLGAVRRR